MLRDKGMFRFKSSSFPQVLTVFKYRGRTEIIGEILKAVKNSRNGKRKSHIMQSVRLSYRQTKKYLNYLVNRGLIVPTEKETYVITKEGSRFLQLIKTQNLRTNTR